MNLSRHGAIVTLLVAATVLLTGCSFGGSPSGGTDGGGSSGGSTGSSDGTTADGSLGSFSSEAYTVQVTATDSVDYGPSVQYVVIKNG